MNKLIVVVGWLILLSAGTAVAGDVGCVPEDVAVKAWSEASPNTERFGADAVVTLSVCTPCTCGGWGTASCYEYMADKARAEESRRQEASGLLNRVKKYGICKMDGGFVAGVRYGLLAYLQDPLEEDIPTITRNAEALYELVVTRGGK